MHFVAAKRPRAQPILAGIIWVYIATHFYLRDRLPNKDNKFKVDIIASLVVRGDWKMKLHRKSIRPILSTLDP